jgi:methylmalonyl-CoA mutase C-terminal domain/subunit
MKRYLMDKTRVLIGLLGLDQHEVGAIAVSRMLRDAGMEVIYAGKFNLPPMIVKTTIEEDVNVIGISCHSWEYLYYIPELIKLLKEKDLEIPVIVGGSVITPRDIASLMDQGVKAAFGPSSEEKDIVQTIRRISGKRAK